MKPKFLYLLAVLVLLSAMASAAFAAPLDAHFTHFQAHVDQHGNLQTQFTEAGLGAQQVVTYALAAHVDAVYVCMDAHGHITNGQVVPNDPSLDAHFTADAHGTVNGSIALGPPDPNAHLCSSGEMVMLAAVRYTDVTLTDTSNNIVFTADHPYGRVFLPQ